MATSKPMVSVMMPTMNRKDDLLMTLHRLSEQSYKNIEIIVVDNCSSDGSAEAVYKKYPHVKFIKLPRNFGAIAARNIGLSNCRGKYWLSLDDDSFPGKDCIKKMVTRFEQDEKLGAIALGILDYWKFWQRDWKSMAEEVPPATDEEPAEKPAWIGCGGAVRMELVKQVGGFEEWGMEAMFERSMAVRIQNLGFKVMSYADIYVYHKWSSSGEPAEFRLADEAMFSGCRSTALFYYKYFPVRNLLTSLLRLCFTAIFATFSQRRFLYLRALFSSLVWAPQVLVERMPLNENILKKQRLPFNFKGK